MSSNLSETKICCFCGRTEDNELEYGKFYQHDGITTHYYCLLLSSNMEQKGNDDEGILGFLAMDIVKEVRRGKKLICFYCKKNGATLGCCNSRCKKIFHFPCGLRAGSLHQFFGEFRSFCISHRPKQKVDPHIKKEAKSTTNVMCYICYENVNSDDFVDTLWAPCCKKNAWFHRTCVQQLAMSAGYFFKCPLCNNKREFQKAMLEYGIFIPSQDASWELVPNAYEELLYRHDRCDAAVCLCPKGRKHTSSNAKWELTLCRTCGSQGIHMACGQLKWANPIWQCIECTTILRKTEGTSNSASNLTSSEDSDTDISVGNESPTPFQCKQEPVESPVKIRPGPKSFKLQQQFKAAREMNSDKQVIQGNGKRSVYMKNVTSNVESREGNSSVHFDYSIVDKILNPDWRENAFNPVFNPKIATGEDIIMIDSDDDVIEISSKPKGNVVPPNSELSREPTDPNAPNPSSLVDTVLHNENENSIEVMDAADEDSLMNIKITNVTSLPPELFATVPNATSLEEQVLLNNVEPETILGPNDEEDLTVIPKKESIKPEPKRKSNSSEQDDSNNSTETNKCKRVRSNEFTAYNVKIAENGVPIVTTMPQIPPGIRNTFQPKNSSNGIPGNQMQLQYSSMASKYPNTFFHFAQTSKTSEEDKSRDQKALNREAVANTVKVDATAAPKDSSRIKAQSNETTSSSSKTNVASQHSQQIPMNCDGDAGTSPAVQSRPDDSAANATTGSGEQEPRKLEERSKTPVLRRTTVTRSARTSQHAWTDHFSQVTSNPYTCNRPRLIPEYIELRDLKFRVCDSDNVQMILYDTFSVNIEINKSSGGKPNASTNENITKSPIVTNSTSFILESNDEERGSGKVSSKANDTSNLTSGNCSSSGQSDTGGRDDTKENRDPTSRCNKSNNQLSSDKRNRSVGDVENAGSSKAINDNHTTRSNICSNEILSYDGTDVNENVRKASQSSVGVRKLRSNSNIENVSNENSVLHSPRKLDVKSVNSNTQIFIGNSQISSNIGVQENSEAGRKPMSLLKTYLSTEDSFNGRSENCLKISIDLSKIQNLIDAKPDLFFKYSKDRDKSSDSKGLLTKENTVPVTRLNGKDVNEMMNGDERLLVNDGLRNERHMQTRANKYFRKECNLNR